MEDVWNRAMNDMEVIQLGRPSSSDSVLLLLSLGIISMHYKIDFFPIKSQKSLSEKEKPIDFY